MTEKTEEKTESPAPKAEHETKKAKPKTHRKRTKKKGPKVVVARGKRKESIARAVLSKGRGTVRYNHAAVSALSNRYIRELIMEPVHYAGAAGTELDIRVNVRGGGVMGQAQAARTAIAKGLVAYLEDESLKQKFLDTDRSLVVEDSRRFESKKYRGPKARARYQKSYR